ncbi:MAG: hypothetical protein L6R40_002340 [Gallowayella cf. fulva]|nr:MAG: hypothetical protein L6R40_002340 [Xanthomendoza cf. fulva]
MPPAQKRRKTGGAAVKKTIAAAPSTQRSIQAFGRISKLQSSRLSVGKSKSKIIKDSLVTVTLPSSPPKLVVGRKRKAEEVEDEPDSQTSSKKRTRSRATIEEDSVPDDRQKFENLDNGDPIPKTPRKNALFKSITIETPTKGARPTLGSLDLSSSHASRRDTSSPISRADTPASSPPPQSQQEAAPNLPEQLQDLINLHSSFLTALSLHYAHHGSLTPADFRLLRPNIERIWRKRRVTIQDVQQILAFHKDASSDPSSLRLSDFGHSKICIEISSPTEFASQHKRPLNEESLNNIFVTNLLAQWKQYTISRPDHPSPEDFSSSLPLAPITPCASASTLAPLLAKGQRRLEDLKAGAIKAQARSSPSKSANKENVAPQPTDPITKHKETQTRKSNLLDRIKSKQEAQLLSTANTTPLTPEQIQRRRALCRLEEIIPVLDLLGSSGNPAIKSFTMPTIVQHLQMSLRNPIENGEAVRAVRLLAEEIAPAWVGIREVGKLVGVTIRRGGIVGGREEVKKVVRRMVAGA